MNISSSPAKNFPATLLVVDMINAMEQPESGALLEQALPMAGRIANLINAARHADIPVVYVNDHFGNWHLDGPRILDHCLYDDVPGRTMTELLRPRDEDYFLVKPRKSAFFGTALDPLLEDLGTESLILAGITGDVCVQLTAIDAHIRNFNLYIPADCVASLSPERNEQALGYMHRVLKADITPSDQITLADIRGDNVLTRLRHALL
ncbi:MAG TPA: isochorismatase family cysteine hydrolase [Moraxellaceae bacterium]